MPIVEINPNARKYAYLEEGGDYGPGMEHEAEVEVTDYQNPAKEAPPYIRDSRPEDFAFFRFRVRRPGGPTVGLRHWEPIGEYTGSNLGSILVNLGVPVEDPDGICRHDTDQVVGRACGLRMGDPRQGADGTWFSGRVFDVMGVD